MKYLIVSGLAIFVPLMQIVLIILAIYALILLIQALRIYIKNNS